jgi:hypothetical protein
MVAPVLGIPLAVKLALNQIKLPLLMGVPLKFDTFDVGVEQGGGVTGQPRLLFGEKVIGIVLNPASVAEPDSVKLPLKGPRGFVSVAEGPARIAHERAG